MTTGPRSANAARVLNIALPGDDRFDGNPVARWQRLAEFRPARGPVVAENLSNIETVRSVAAAAAAMRGGRSSAEKCFSQNRRAGNVPNISISPPLGGNADPPGNASEPKIDFG